MVYVVEVLRGRLELVAGSEFKGARAASCVRVLVLRVDVRWERKDPKLETCTMMAHGAAKARDNRANGMWTRERKGPKFAMTMTHGAAKARDNSVHRTLLTNLMYVRKK